MSKQPKPSVRVRRASETNDAVEKILSSTTQMAADFSGIPGAADNVRRLRRGEACWWPPEMRRQIPADLLTPLMDYVARQAVVELWKTQGRIAYDLHPEMSAQLYRADMKGKLPGGLFRRLPHINPMIPLPRPWPFRAENGRTALIRAYFITGYVGLGFCPTTDPRAEGLAVMPWVEWQDTDANEYSDAATPLLAVPLSDEPFDLDDIVRHTNAWQGTHTDGNEIHAVKQLLPGLVSVLTYLCCDNRDVQEPRAYGTGASKRKKAVPPRDPFWVQVGWHIGPQLHAARMLAQGGGVERGGVSVPSGVEYGPQHRAGHFKTVRHGKGRTQASTQWIDPYWTKLDLLKQMQEEGKEIGTGVIPVNRQERDPSNHRDVKLANLGTAKSKEIRAREAQQAREDSMDW